MRKFDYKKLAENKWDTEILSYIAKIHEYKGRQELFIHQKTDELERLRVIATVQSTESSNKIEGIITTNTRIKQLVNEKIAPRNRDESEIMGYRDVLKMINESFKHISIKPPYILQMHRDLLKRTNLSYGGKYKNVQNYINKTSPNGIQNTIFVPVSPHETPDAIQEICDCYNRAISLEIIDPLILIPVFILDFLCIHAFNDGNGRISRLLTLLLLYQNGYEVGKYISLEKQIELTKDIYYDVLEESNYGWHNEDNDPTPFIRYTLKMILACYLEFEEKVDILNSAKNKAYDIVLKFVNKQIGKFTSNDVIISCPSIGRSSILNALNKLVTDGIISKYGQGKNTYYVKNNE